MSDTVRNALQDERHPQRSATRFFSFWQPRALSLQRCDTATAHATHSPTRAAAEPLQTTLKNPTAAVDCMRCLLCAALNSPVQRCPHHCCNLIATPGKLKKTTFFLKIHRSRRRSACKTAHADSTQPTEHNYSLKKHGAEPSRTYFFSNPVFFFLFC